MINSKIPIAFLNTDIIDGNDFVKFADTLAVNYRIDIYDKNNIDFKAAKLIFEKCLKAQFSKEEFENASDRMLKKQRFATWNIADFFEYERSMVYTREEVYKLSDGTLNGFRRVECKGIKIPIWAKETEELKPPLKWRVPKPEIY